MRKQLTFSLALIATLSACKSKPELIFSEPEAEVTCQLHSAIHKVKYLNNGSSDGDTVIYNYDALTRLVKIESSWPDIVIVYNDNNLIKSTNNAPRLIRQLEYDKRGNIKVDIRTDLSYPEDNNTYIYIHEYDDDNHLIQTVFFTEGKYNLKSIYKANFEAFLAAGIDLYNSQSSELEKSRVMLQLEDLSCIKYNIDTNAKTVIMSMNYDTLIDGKTLSRKEEVRAIYQFDGKKSPKSSRNWRNYTMLTEGMDFSELGNVTKLTNTTRHFWNGYADYVASYEYNNSGYPVRSKSTSSASEINTDWIYKCE